MRIHLSLPIAVAAFATIAVAAATPASADALDGVDDYVATREGAVQVVVYDNVTGHTAALTDGHAKQYTASIQKVDIMAKWLRSYQDDGIAIPSKVPYSQQFLLKQMIEVSDNSAATALFHFGGGCRAFRRFNELIPMDDTVVGCETPTYYGWGNTLTSAADQVDLMKVFAYGARQKVGPKSERKVILRKPAREYGLGLMQNIQANQHWGITCGPWGNECDPPTYAPRNPDVTVALKNGWKTLPTCEDPIEQCPWQVNSIGWVKGDGRDYVLAVLTTKNPVGTGGIYGFQYGIDTIQWISGRIWDNLE